MNPLIVFGACAAVGAVVFGREQSGQAHPGLSCAQAHPGISHAAWEEETQLGGFGPWSGGHRVPVARGGQRQRLWGGPTGHKYPVQQDFRSQVRRPPPTIPYQQQSYYGEEQTITQTITLTVEQMRLLHREGEVVVDGIMLKFVRPPRRTGGAPRPRRDRRGGGAPRPDGTSPPRPGKTRVSGFGAPLTSAQRRELPDRAFALIQAGKRKYPLWDAEGLSRGHAIAAKGRALTAMRGGYINKRQYNQIVRKADGVLRELGDR